MGLDLLPSLSGAFAALLLIALSPVGKVGAIDIRVAHTARGEGPEVLISLEDQREDWQPPETVWMLPHCQRSICYWQNLITIFLVLLLRQPACPKLMNFKRSKIFFKTT